MNALHELIVVWGNYERVEAVVVQRHWLACLEEGCEGLGVLIDEERLLKGFSILREPFVLKALLGCRSKLWVHVDHLQEELLAFWAHVVHLGLDCDLRVRKLVGCEHFLP